MKSSEKYLWVVEDLQDMKRELANIRIKDNANQSNYVSIGCLGELGCYCI